MEVDFIVNTPVSILVNTTEEILKRNFDFRSVTSKYLFINPEILALDNNTCAFIGTMRSTLPVETDYSTVVIDTIEVKTIMDVYNPYKEVENLLTEINKKTGAKTTFYIGHKIDKQDQKAILLEDVNKARLLFTLRGVGEVVYQTPNIDEIIEQVFIDTFSSGVMNCTDAKVFPNGIVANVRFNGLIMLINTGEMTDSYDYMCYRCDPFYRREDYVSEALYDLDYKLGNILGYEHPIRTVELVSVEENMVNLV